MYYFDEGDGVSIGFIDSHYHLWTIRDAEDGDVLATEDWVFIFEKMKSNGKPACYCHYDIELGFRIDTNSYIATGQVLKSIQQPKNSATNLKKQWLMQDGNLILKRKR